MNNLYLEVYETLASILFPEIFMLITIGGRIYVLPYGTLNRTRASRRMIFYHVQWMGNIHAHECALTSPYNVHPVSSFSRSTLVFLAETILLVQGSFVSSHFYTPLIA
jgi:hypothetical protein